MSTEKERLQHARTLIMQKQFDQARLILLEIPHDPTAQQWLAKLEEIAPTGTGTPPRVEPVSPIRAIGAPPPTPDPAVVAPLRNMAAPNTVNIALNISTIRYTVAAITGIAAVLMIASFFFAPWIDMGNISFFGMNLGAMAEQGDKGKLEITAIELWTGRNNGENFVLDAENPEGDFADVRLLDRLLILIPMGAVVLAWFAWMYLSGDMNALMTIGTMTVIAFLLLAAPFAWESLSNQQIEDDFRASMEIEGGGDFGFDFGALFGEMLNIWEDTYSTGEQKILGGLALLACLLGFGAEVMTETSPAGRR